MKTFFAKLGTAEIRNILSIINNVGVYALLFVLIFVGVPKENSELIYMALGLVIGSGFSPSNNFFFGSSKTESDKSKNEKPN